LKFTEVRFGDGVLNLDPKEDAASHSLEDLAEMFGLNTNISDIPVLSDFATLPRRNTSAIKRRLKSCS